MSRDDRRQAAFFAVVFLVGGNWLGLSAQPAQSDPLYVKESGNMTVNVSSPSSSRLAGADILANDPRLAVKVTLRTQDVGMTTALESLGGLGHVKLRSNLSQPNRVSFSCQDVPLRAVLDSIASAYDGEWRRGPKATLELVDVYNSHELDPMHPHTQAQADEDAAGRPLPGELEQLPPDTLQALEQNQETPNTPPGLPFGSLPSAMQETLRQMQQADLRVQAEQGLNGFQNTDVSNTRIVLQKESNSQFTQYNVTFVLPPMTVGGLTYSSSGSYEATATVYEDPRDQNPGIVPVSAISPGPPQGAGDAQADAASRAAALTTDPALKRRVNLNTDMASLSDTLVALGIKTGLAYATQEQDALRSVTYKDTPLSDVLDRLAARYTTDTLQCTWGVRPSGVVVFHYGVTLRHQEEIQAQATAAAAAFSQAAIARASGNDGQ